MSCRWYAYRIGHDMNGDLYIPSGSDNVLAINGRFNKYRAISIAESIFAKDTRKPYLGFVLVFTQSVAHRAATCTVVGNINLSQSEALPKVNEGTYK